MGLLWSIDLAGQSFGQTSAAAPDCFARSAELEKSKLSCWFAVYCLVRQLQAQGTNNPPQKMSTWHVGQVGYQASQVRSLSIFESCFRRQFYHWILKGARTLKMLVGHSGRITWHCKHLRTYLWKSGAVNVNLSIYLTSQRLAFLIPV